jgi:sugar O-acyltransferase (sialic acid O-acetyltransferase NeuD family)
MKHVSIMESMNSLKLLMLIGCGGHAKVLLDALDMQQLSVDALIIQESQRQSAAVLARLFNVGKILTDEELLAGGRTTETLLINGVGSIRDASHRRRLFQTYIASGFAFEAVVHPSAIVSKHAYLGSGAQVMAGAILQAGTRIGANAIINTGAVIDHDCIVGDHTHVAPGAVVSGGVRVGSACHIGTGAHVIQGVSIGDGGVIGAGAVVIRDVGDNQTVVGVPARVIRR